MSDSRIQPNKNHRHRQRKLSVMIPALAGIMLVVLLAVLWCSDNLLIQNNREESGFFEVQDISCREVAAPETPIGLIREYSFQLTELQRDTTLAFYTVHQYARVFIDGEMVYSMESAGPAGIHTVGSNWTMLPLYREDAGKSIRVEIIPVYESFRDQEVTFLVGSRLSICANRFWQDSPLLILSILSVFVGIILLCTAVYKQLVWHNIDGLAHLGLFAILVGLWRLTDTRFTPFLYPEKPVFLFYISLAVMMIGIISLIKSLEPHINRCCRRIMDLYCIAAASVSIVLVLLQVFHIRDLRENLLIIHLMIGLGAAVLVGSTIYDRLQSPKNKTGVLLSIGILILAAGMAADAVMFYVRHTSSGLVFSLLAILIYICILGANMLLRFVVQEKQLAKIELQLAEQEHQLTENRIAAMISQIKPHFIYNTLGSIEQLCEVNPEAAAKLVHDFARYLRGNFSELDNHAPIRMSQEMEHVRCYVRIEQTRFPDITVDFDLQSEDFLLPALSVQPLVENAIKHGLMKLPKGGSITISTFETDTHYCVQIRDTGMGFDTAGVWEDPRHVGLRNIRGRLEAMCGGTLTVESTPGIGTIATIRIPKEEKS